MKNRFLIHIIILAVFSLASCQKVLDVDESASEHQMVLNGVPSAGKQLFVNFANSRYFLDGNGNHPIDGTTMSINVNGTDHYPTSVSNCNYFFGYTLQEDDALSITINANGNKITSSTYVPRQPQVSSLISFVDTSQVFNTLNINFNLADHPNYKDYYHITIMCRDSGLYHHPLWDTYDTIDTTYTTYFCCFDNKLTDPAAAASQALGGYFYSELLTTDKFIDGENHNVSMLLMLLTDTNEVAPYLHQYTLNIETVTPDRYHYLEDVAKATNMLQMFSEPGSVYSNVNGALGIFAGNARKTFPLSQDTLPAAKCHMTIPQDAIKHMKRR